MDTSDRIYDDFIQLIFFAWSPWRKKNDLDNELPGSEESNRFRFLHTDCLIYLKGSSVGLIFAKTLDMRISIHTTFNLFPRPFSSVFFLSDTCWVFILAFYLASFHGIFLTEARFSPEDRWFSHQFCLSRRGSTSSKYGCGVRFVFCRYLLCIVASLSSCSFLHFILDDPLSVSQNKESLS